MYSVLIAEDELLVRMGIASSVPWVQLGMRVVSETADGLSAWQAFEKFHPDIVIADIRMPRMDGMELLRRIHAKDADCAVIIITNVEFEETLQEARALGVVDVLLKASMKREDIMEAMLRAKDQLVRCHRAGSAEDIGDKSGWRRLLLEDGAPERFPGLFSPKQFILLQICPSERLSYRLEESLKNLFEHRLNTLGAFTTIPLELGAIAITHEAVDCKAVIHSLAELRRYVCDNFSEELRFILCTETLGPDRLRDYVEHARKHLSRSDLFAKGILQLDAQAKPVFPELGGSLRMLERCALVTVENKWFLRFHDSLCALPEALYQSRDHGRIFADGLLDELGKKDIWNDTEELVRLLTDGVEKKCERTLRDIHPKILEAAEYMRQHLDEKLSIQAVSRQIGYHPNYFSNLFKQELGMSWTDFLNNLRLQRAKALLLETDNPLQVIAESCGFPDLSYFSVRFKRAEGISPSQWRAKK